MRTCLFCDVDVDIWRVGNSLTWVNSSAELLGSSQASEGTMNVLLLTFLAVSGLEATRGTSCGPPFGKTPFDAAKFSGDWFIAAIGRPLDERGPLSCLQTHYSVTGQGNDTRIEIKVHFKTQAGGDFNIIIRGEPITPGVNSVLQAVYRMDGQSEWKTVFTHSVIGTDYDTFGVVRTCHMTYDHENDRFVRNPTFQIWSRNRTLDAATLSTLQTMGRGFEYEIVKDIDLIANVDC